MTNHLQTRHIINGLITILRLQLKLLYIHLCNMEIPWILKSIDLIPEFEWLHRPNISGSMTTIVVLEHSSGTHLLVQVVVVQAQSYAPDSKVFHPREMTVLLTVRLLQTDTQQAAILPPSPHRHHSGPATHWPQLPVNLVECTPQLLGRVGDVDQHKRSLAGSAGRLLPCSHRGQETTVYRVQTGEWQCLGNLMS